MNDAQPHGQRSRSARLWVVTAHGHEELILRDHMTLGRAFSCDLRLDGDDLSRAHATIDRQGQSYILRDMKSRNGVLVNGKKVDRWELQADDVLMLGGNILVFDPADTTRPDKFIEQVKRHDEARKKASGANPSANDNARPANDAQPLENLLRTIERSGVPPADPSDSFESDKPKLPSSKPTEDGLPPTAKKPTAPRPAVADAAMATADSDKGSLLDPLHRKAIVRRTLGSTDRALALALWTASHLDAQQTVAELCQEAAKFALDLVGGDKALVMVRRPGDLPDEDSVLQTAALIQRRMTGGALILPAVLEILHKEKRAIVSGSPENDNRLMTDRSKLRADSISALLGLPIMDGNKMRGLFYIESHDPSERFGPLDMSLLAVLGAHIQRHLKRILGTG